MGRNKRNRGVVEIRVESWNKSYKIFKKMSVIIFVITVEERQQYHNYSLISIS